MGGNNGQVWRQMPSWLGELQPSPCLQVIEIEKSAGQFYRIIGQNQPVFKFTDSERNKGKSCVKYIYFYDIKIRKYMKFTKFTILC